VRHERSFIAGFDRMVMAFSVMSFAAWLVTVTRQLPTAWNSIVSLERPSQENVWL
jgi:hypothetical protein